jgi:hypothetical protein
VRLAAVLLSASSPSFFSSAPPPLTGPSCSVRLRLWLSGSTLATTQNTAGQVHDWSSKDDNEFVPAAAVSFSNSGFCVGLAFLDSSSLALPFVYTQPKNSSERKRTGRERRANGATEEDDEGLRERLFRLLSRCWRLLNKPNTHRSNKRKTGGTSRYVRRRRGRFELSSVSTTTITTTTPASATTFSTCSAKRTAVAVRNAHGVTLLHRLRYRTRQTLPAASIEIARHVPLFKK